MVPGPSVSISPTTAPAALSRLISPAMPELLATVNVWLPDWAEVNSGAHSVLLTVTASAALLAAAGIAAIVTPGREGRDDDEHARHRPRAAARAAAPSGPSRGLATERRRRRQRRRTRAAEGLAAGLTARPAFTNAGMTTTR